MVPSVGREGRMGNQGVWDKHVHTAIFKMNNQQGPTIQPRELCSRLCGSLDGREVWRIDTLRGFPGGASGKEPTCQCRRCKRHRFDPLEEGTKTQSIENPLDRGPWGWSYGPQGRKESDTTEATQQAHTDTCICMAESLYCPSETITLLICY